MNTGMLASIIPSKLACRVARSLEGWLSIMLSSKKARASAFHHARKMASMKHGLPSFMQDRKTDVRQSFQPAFWQAFKTEGNLSR